MTVSQELFTALTRGIVLERNQGLDVEARHILPSGWQLECRHDGYLFVGPWSDEWDDNVWDIVRFLAYTPLLSLRRAVVAGRVEYELVSCTENGNGFKVTFRSTDAR